MNIEEAKKIVDKLSVDSDELWKIPMIPAHKVKALLDTLDQPKPEIPEGVDCVVSNPPFSKRDAIFNKLYELDIPFALIMNMNGLFDSKTRFKLFQENNFELLIPKGRMKFFDEQMVSRNNPNFQSIYVCNGVLNKQIEFTDMVAEFTGNGG